MTTTNAATTQTVTTEQVLLVIDFARKPRVQVALDARTWLTDAAALLKKNPRAQYVQAIHFDDDENRYDAKHRQSMCHLTKLADFVIVGTHSIEWVLANLDTHPRLRPMAERWLAENGVK